MKDIVKILGRIVLVILIIQMLYIPNNVYATDHWGSVVESGDEFLELGKNSTTKSDKQEIQVAVDFAYNALLIIGIVASVLIGVILGIKYMTQSVEEQAKIKETLIIYAVGCIVTFGAFGIWKMVIEIMKQV